MASYVVYFVNQQAMNLESHPQKIPIKNWENGATSAIRLLTIGKLAKLKGEEMKIGN